MRAEGSMSCEPQHRGQTHTWVTRVSSRNSQMRATKRSWRAGSKPRKRSPGCRCTVCQQACIEHKQQAEAGRGMHQQ